MILHIDLDCFFVSVARIKDKTLIGKNVVVVNGSADDNEKIKEENGVVLSAGYEARKFGIKSAMP